MSEATGDILNSFPAIQIARSFHLYDVRGVVPQDINPNTAEIIGAAFVDEIVAADTTSQEQAVVIGRDMRDTGEELASAFAKGVRARGIPVIDISLCSTDELYFASGYFGAYGAMFTASHNPAKYNGIKFCRPGAKPIGADTGLFAIRDQAISLVRAHFNAGSLLADMRQENVLDRYANHLRNQVDLGGINPLKVVVDAGNGMGGLTVPAVFDGLPIELVAMNFQLDGSFPVHEANPLEPSNTADLQQRVVAERADLGLAFDGDADRCFVIDERGERVNPSALIALIGSRLAVREPDAVILHNVITSRFVPIFLATQGIKTVKTRVGHSFIKKEMEEHRAVFAGEHSGHFYFRDFFGADSGLLAALWVIAILGSSQQTLSQLSSEYDPYFGSGEVNISVDLAKSARAIDQVKNALADKWGGETLDEETIDGCTISHWDTEPQWWVNIRPSNTESLLRVNVEAQSPDVLHQVLEQVTKAIVPRDRG